MSEIAAVAIPAGCRIRFHRLIEFVCMRAEYAKRSLRTRTRLTVRRARAAKSGSNNNSFELKTNSAIGGHEGKRQRPTIQ